MYKHYNKLPYKFTNKQERNARIKRSYFEKEIRNKIKTKIGMKSLERFSV
jgi:hypothetical protein